MGKFDELGIVPVEPNMAYLNELIANGYPVETKPYKDREMMEEYEVVNKSHTPLAPHRLAECGMNSSYEINSLISRANSLRNSPLFSQDLLDDYINNLNLVGSPDESIFRSNLKMRLTPDFSRPYYTEDEIKLQAYLHYLNIDQSTLQEIFDATKSDTSKPLSAEEDLDAFAVLLHHIGYLFKYSGGHFGNGSIKRMSLDYFMNALNDLLKIRGLNTFTNFPRRVMIKNITDSNFTYLNSENYACFDKFYCVADKTNIGAENITLVTDKRPVQYTKDTLLKRRLDKEKDLITVLESKDTRIKLQIKSEDADNIENNIYYVNLNRDYVEFIPVFYITVKTKPKTSGYTNEYNSGPNLEYYHLLFWNSVELYVSVRVFELGYAQQNVIRANKHGYVMGIAYDYDSAKLELERVVALLSHSNRLGSVARMSKYAASDSLDDYLDYTRQTLGYGKNGMESGEAVETF